MTPLRQKRKSQLWTCLLLHSRELHDFIAWKCRTLFQSVRCYNRHGCLCWLSYVMLCGHLQSIFLFSKFPLVVASIEEFADRYHVPKPFIGLILLPIVVSGAIFALCNFRPYSVHPGQCSRTCHLDLDGNEKPNGTHYNDLCGQLHCTSS